MTLHDSTRHSVIERHLLMAQRCNALAAQLHHSGDAEAAARQRQLLAVFLHNALMQLPSLAVDCGSASPPGGHAQSLPDRLAAFLEPAVASEGKSPAPADAAPLHWTLGAPGGVSFRPPL